jgi:hypothetical protein
MAKARRGDSDWRATLASLAALAIEHELDGWTFEEE